MRSYLKSFGLLEYYIKISKFDLWEIN